MHAVSTPVQAPRTARVAAGEYVKPRRHRAAMAAPAAAPPKWAALSILPPPLKFETTPHAMMIPSQRAIACVSGPRHPCTRQPTTRAAATTPEIAPDAPTVYCAPCVIQLYAVLSAFPRAPATRYIGAILAEPTARSTSGPACQRASMLKPRCSMPSCKKHAVTKVSQRASPIVASE